MKVQDFFKESFYINLDSRTDRKEQFEEEMKKVGLEDYSKRVSATPWYQGLHQKSECLDCQKQAACSMSHYNIIKDAKERNLDNVLIFEDDIIFNNEGEKSGIQIIEESLDQLSLIPDWHIIHFSAFMLEDELKLVSPNLIQSNGCLTTHAYGINKTAFNFLLKFEVGKDSAFDGWMGQRHFIKKYITYPLSIYQREGVSDLDAYGRNPGLHPYLHHYSKPIIKLYE
jgi:GR25 family glycosyltransferase involved in LPS biosynthesis